MADEEQVKAIQAQLRMLEDQRSWLKEVASTVTVEEQRERCLLLIEKLGKKIESLQKRVAEAAARG